MKSPLSIILSTLLIQESSSFTSSTQRKKLFQAFRFSSSSLFSESTEKIQSSPTSNDDDNIFPFQSLLPSSQKPLSSTSAACRLNKLQANLITQTLTRIFIPSLSAAFLCFLTFAPVTHAIFTYVQTSFDGVETGTGYEALNLILTDNSNQFIQNAHNFLALNFCFLTTYTFAFLYNNQVRLYQALYDEVGILISLLEQIALSTEGRIVVYKLLLLCIQKYVEDDLKVVTNLGASDSMSAMVAEVKKEDLPVLLVSQRPRDDPLETILYLTSVGQPSHVYVTIKSLRTARAHRLASLQRKMPEVNMYLLYILGFTAWITFPIVTAGSSTVGGEELINVYRNQLSLGIFAMGCVLGIINELKQPEIGSAYNVDYNLLGKLIDGLENELSLRLSKCSLADCGGDNAKRDDYRKSNWNGIKRTNISSISDCGHVDGNSLENQVSNKKLSWIRRRVLRRFTKDKT